MDCVSCPWHNTEPKSFVQLIRDTYNLKNHKTGCTSSNLSFEEANWRATVKQTMESWLTYTSWSTSTLDVTVILRCFIVDSCCSSLDTMVSIQPTPEWTWTFQLCFSHSPSLQIMNVSRAAVRQLLSQTLWRHRVVPKEPHRDKTDLKLLQQVLAGKWGDQERVHRPVPSPNSVFVFRHGTVGCTASK